MTKIEEIDGIFGVIDLWACNAVRKRPDGASVYNPYNTKDLSVMLYDAGYRKIDDNCAVITKDDLDIYKKQAVKEFAEKLKERLSKCSGCYIPNCFESPTDEFAYNAKEVEKIIDKLLKEYEVEE